MSEKSLKDRQLVHGVLMAVFGRGVLIIGPSGAGKSELALGLLDRGHKLVADDSVEIVNSGRLIGSAPALTAGLLAVRDVGVIDAATAFGSGSVIESVEIEFCVELVSDAASAVGEFTGHDPPAREILGVELPCLRLGTNGQFAYPVMIETWLRLGPERLSAAAHSLRSRHDALMFAAEKEASRPTAQNAVQTND